jgi:thiamine biosynthesis lipoprotein
MNRRDFLHPRRLAKTAADVFDLVEELHPLKPPESPFDQEIALLTFSRRAMATSFEVLVPFATDHALEAAEAALDEIDRLEAQLTVYRDDSEVSRLNLEAAGEAVVVEEALFGLFLLAERISRETDGAFDISTGALTKAWGFFRRCGRVPAAEDLQEVLQRVGMSQVVLTAEDRTVRFLRTGLEINLGSIGKGYALDRAAALVRDQWCMSGALLHGGHSSMYAVGSQPGSIRGWPVAVRHPWDGERLLALVYVRDQGLATSAATFQHLEHEGRKLGHILDPRTGWPAVGLASASAIAPTAAEADALSTAFFILGVEKTREYCATHPGVGAILLPQEENARPVVCGLGSEKVVLYSY